MNAWENINWIASEALVHLEDALVITQLAGRDTTAEFNSRPNGYAVGQRIDIRTNPVYKATEFSTDIEIQSIRSAKRDMEIEKHFDVSVKMTAREKRMNFESFSEQVIKPGVYAIAEACDRYVGSKITEAAGLYVSTDLFGSAADMALAKKAATFQQLNPTGRFTIMNDDLEAKLLGKDYFNTSNNRGESGVRVFNEGTMGRAMGMEHFASLNFPEWTYTPGTGAGTTNNTTTTDNLVGNKVLVLDGASGTFKAGDRVMVAGVRRPLIVATETAVGAGPAAASVPLVDPIMEIIPDNAAVTVISASTAFTLMGAIFDDASLAFASPALDPASDKPTAIMSSNGYTMRVITGYDINKKSETLSIDMLCGATAWDPRRITLLGHSGA